MVNYTVVNTTRAVTASLNAGAKTVPALDARSGIALDATELAAAIATAGVFVLKDAPSNQTKRNLARLLKYKQVTAVA